MSSVLHEILGDDIPEIKIDLKIAKTGVVHDFDLYDEFGNVIVWAETKITRILLDNLISRGIRFLYYTPPEMEKSVLKKDNAKKNIIPEEIQQEALEHTKEILEYIREIYNFHPEKRVSKSKIDKARSIVNKIVNNLEKNDKIKDCIFIPLAKLKNLDEYTFIHSSCVSFMGAILGTKLNLRKEFRIRMGIGGLLHDIGKSSISDEILCKEKSLNEKEKKIIREHPMTGYKLIADNPNLYDFEKKIVLLHHERPDSTGYPFGYDFNQYKEKVPRTVRQMSICDVYSALISKRPYKESYSSKKALRTIINSVYAPFKKNALFLYEDVRDFLRALDSVLNTGDYFLKKGNVLRLNTGEIAIIEKMRQKQPLNPIIKIMCDDKMKRLDRPIIIDLAKDFSRTITYIYDIGTDDIDSL